MDLLLVLGKLSSIREKKKNKNKNLLHTHFLGPKQSEAFAFQNRPSFGLATFWPNLNRTERMSQPIAGADWAHVIIFAPLSRFDAITRRSIAVAR